MNSKAKAGLFGMGMATIFVAISLLTEKKEKLPVVPVIDGDTRKRILDAAIGEIGQQDPRKYWLDVVPDHPGFTGSWCGGFALWAIHQAQIAKGINWEIGKGFCYRLPQTTHPLPGDIAYIEKPFQHHAIVETVNADGTVTTIDGNQVGNTVSRRTRQRSAITAFFSIDDLIRQSTAIT